MKIISPTSASTVALPQRQVWTWQQATIPSAILLAFALFGAATGSSIGLLELVITPGIVFLYALHFGKLVSRTGFNGWTLLALFIPILNFVVIVLAAKKDGPVEAKRVARQQRLDTVKFTAQRANSLTR